MQQFSVGPYAGRGIVKLNYPFSRNINEELKKFPGVKPVYEETGRSGASKFLYWQGPDELRYEYIRIAKAYRLEYVENLVPERHPEVPHIDTRCMAHQVEAIMRIYDEKSHLISFETGGGKTFAAIEAIRGLKPGRVLIVCPANAKAVWVSELQKWTPKLAEKFTVVQPGKAIIDATHVIVNYELLYKVPVAPWDFIVIDELHYIAKGGEGGSKRAKLVNELARLNPNAYRVGLTATPVMTDPKQFFWQADFLFPDRFGTYGHFMKRYSGKTENAYATSGYTYEGLDKDNADEFTRRIKSISTRATMDDFGEHLPGFVVKVVKHRPNSKFNPEAAVKAVLSGKMKADDIVKQHTVAKIKIAADEIAEAAKKSTHVIALTHYIESAERLVEALKPFGLDPVLVTGAVPVAKRRKLIDDEIAAKNSVLVCTMHSIKESIDLTAYTKIFVVELYWSPGIITQALGRFHRLSSKKPAQATILCVEGSAEENIASILEHRFSEQSALYSATPTESITSGALKEGDKHEDFAAYLRDIVKDADLTPSFSYIDEDE